MAGEIGVTASKSCKACGVALALDRFPKVPKARDGRGGICYACKRVARGGEYHTDAQREALRLRMRDWKARNRLKVASHLAVARAIKSGRLVRGCCEVCGASDTEAHHDDYDVPLNVRWLCKAHHEVEHMIADRRAA